jgi:hypothetical protein
MISLLTPTRGRLDGVSKLMKSAISTAEAPLEIEFVFYVDDDDDTYDVLIENPLHIGVPPEFRVPEKWVRGPRIVLSEMWNRCYEQAKGPYYYHMGDDNIFRTRGWDTQIYRAFEKYPDKILFVHGKDGSPHDATGFGTHGVLHRAWVECVGYFVPPYFSSDYNDTWLNEVSRAIDRHMCLPYMVEHMHPNFGKAELDLTHQERLKRQQDDNVDATYWSKAGERKADADKLLAYIRNYSRRSDDS